MSRKFVFEKLFERDTTLILQQACANAHHKGLFDLIRESNPFENMTAHYMNNNCIEVWKIVENVKYLKKKDF